MEFIIDGMTRALGLLINFDPETYAAIWATIQVSSLSMVASLIVGLPLGFGLGHFTFPGKRMVKTILDSLLALPTVVIGLLVYALITSRGPLGDWNLLFTLPAIAMGQFILALPIVVALTASTVNGLDSRLGGTLLTLGASRYQVIKTILWEARYAILVAAMAAYGRVVSEVGISMMVGGNIKWHTRTITTTVALETSKGQFANGIALGLVLMIVALSLNIGLSFLRQRSGE